MPSVLHPCPGCGHESMDECWSVSKEFPTVHRRMCVECHDDCLPRIRRTAAKAPHRGKKVPGAPDPRLLFAGRSSS